ncbi:MAG: hypothetical protein QM811_23735 [Pirellulales bacterium]
MTHRDVSATGIGVRLRVGLSLFQDGPRRNVELRRPYSRRRQGGPGHTIGRSCRHVSHALGFTRDSVPQERGRSILLRKPHARGSIARLHYLVDERRHVGLLAGIDGGGKSLLLEVFDRQVRRAGTQVVHLSLLGIDSHEMLWCVAADLGANPDRDATDFQLSRTIVDCLAANRLHDAQTVFLLDDADEADPVTLDALVRLMDAERTTDSCTTFIVAVAQGQIRRLPPRMLAQVELRVSLDHWEESDTANYLFNSLRQAGRHDAPFSADAVRKLHALCGGVPRRITQLANLALLAGAGRNVQRIDADMVESAWSELGLAEAA